MTDNDHKISPYLNNYGQIIIGATNEKKVILNEFQNLQKKIKEEKNKIKDDEFSKLFEDFEKFSNFFNYIELFKLQRIKNNQKKINYLFFRFKFNKASNNKVKYDFPPYLLIEPVSACNLKCPMCFQIDKSFTRKPFMGIMKMPLFKKVVDEANEIGVGAITLASRGEPTMHPKLSEMLDYIRQKENIYELKLNTNGSFLTESLCHKIFEYKVDTIVISADHYEKETFEKLRKGSNYEKIVENVKMLHSIREKHYKQNETEIRISGVDYYKNLDQKKFYNFWIPYADNVSSSAAVERWDTYNNSPDPKISSPCTFLWDRMYVWFDGKCNPCDADYKSYLSYGNVANETIKNIWNGDKLNELREKHLKSKRVEINPCDRCGIDFQ